MIGTVLNLVNRIDLTVTWTAQIVVSGNTAILRCNGAVGATVDWMAELEAYIFTP